jgi:hypothetical protein
MQYISGIGVYVQTYPLYAICDKNKRLISLYFKLLALSTDNDMLRIAPTINYLL